MKFVMRFLLILAFFLTLPFYLPAFQADVQVLNDSAYFKTVYSLFTKAQKSIYVIMYRATYYDKYPDSPSNRLIKGLMAARRRGVDVRVILDRIEERRKKFGKTPDNERIAEMLTSEGVKVYLDDKKITTHSKLIIVDGRRVIVGSTNWSYYALTENNETNAFIESEKVAGEYIRYFNELATLCTPVKP